MATPFTRTHYKTVCRRNLLTANDSPSLQAVAWPLLLDDVMVLRCAGPEQRGTELGEGTQGESGEDRCAQDVKWPMGSVFAVVEEGALVQEPDGFRFAAAARAGLVDDLDAGQVVYEPARRPGAAAQVGVLEVHEESFVEGSYVSKRLPADGHAGAGDPVDSGRVGAFRNSGELALHERALGKQAGQKRGAPEEPGEGTDLTPRRKLKLPLGVQYSWSDDADPGGLFEECLQDIEEILIHDRVRVYEDHDVPARGGDSHVVGTREPDVFLVPDETHPSRQLRWFVAVVVHDHGLEVPVAGLGERLYAAHGMWPGGVVDDEHGELHRDSTLSCSRRAMLAAAASEDSLRSLRTSASESCLRFWIPARFSRMSGRWRQAPASPSRCARKEPVAAALTKRASCPRTKKGSMCGTDETGRSLTSRLREFCVPSRVAVGLRLPPVEALPMW